MGDGSLRINAPLSIPQVYDLSCILQAMQKDIMIVFGCPSGNFLIINIYICLSLLLCFILLTFSPQLHGVTSQLPFPKCRPISETPPSEKTQPKGKGVGFAVGSRCSGWDSGTSDSPGTSLTIITLTYSKWKWGFGEKWTIGFCTWTGKREWELQGLGVS